METSALPVASDAVAASPFLRLPGELRNSIYGHVIGDEVERSYQKVNISRLLDGVEETLASMVMYHLPREIRDQVFAWVLRGEPALLSKTLVDDDSSKVYDYGPPIKVPTRTQFHAVRPLHHLSKTIREEILSLRPIRIHRGNANAFLRRVYPPYTSDLKPADLSKYCGNVVINMSDRDSNGYFHLDHPQDRHGEDGLLYAIRLATSSPKCHIAFTHVPGDDLLAGPKGPVAHLDRSLSERQEIRKLLTLGRVLSLTIDATWYKIGITVAAGVRDLLFWPDTKEVVDERSLIVRLGLSAGGLGTQGKGWTADICRLHWRSRDGVAMI